MRDTARPKADTTERRAAALPRASRKPVLTNESAPLTLEYLQRTAGNAAVAELVQRQVATPSAGSTAPYRPGEMSKRYWALSAAERSQVNMSTDHAFVQQTGIMRHLDWNNPVDRPSARIWLRLRDQEVGKLGAPTTTGATAAPPKTAATPAATPLWPKGPMSARKSAAHTLDEYVGWVRELEVAYSGRENAAQRLRRLYYSDFVSSQLKAAGQKPGAGSLFDKTISTSSPGDAPLESPPISQTALDGLFETDTIVTPGGFTVDVAHIWADLDLAISGKTGKASAGSVALGADFQGILTWTGDLASWFVEFVTRIRKMTGKVVMPSAGNMADLDKALGLDAHALLMSLVNSKVSKEDLVSDFDAQVIVKQNVKPGHLYGGTPTANLADMLESYYKPATSGPAPELSRFAAFVRSARPEIPYELDPAAPYGIRLSSKATGVVLEALYSTAEVLLTATQGHNVTPASDLEFVLLEIARRFTEFLATGLEKGDAPWP